MSLVLQGYISLPEHIGAGGFDHAAVDTDRGLLYVAHTANDALDVIDCLADRYLRSIGGLSGVAGALVSVEDGLVFTSNRGEGTIGIFAPEREADLTKVRVGVRPNGLAYDTRRHLLLAANVGDPAQPGSHTVSLVDVNERTQVADIPVAGRTRWTIYDGETDAFYVNIADPPQIAAVSFEGEWRVARTFDVPVAGPHGLDINPESRRLFCACDGKRLVTFDLRSGKPLQEVVLAGVPDVIFFNQALSHLYVAIGDPGLIEVFDTTTLDRLEAIPTEAGAHTIGFDAARNKVYAFLPQSHRASVYGDSTD